ncbi:MAG: DEAD/DEAH box helicase family protein [Clostridium sp.]|nr:DEAD/DEAH box helicase family protein [Clostridium sp.]
MLKTDVTWPESFRYQTNSESEPVGFFSEALCNATSFDLMLGFFSSSAINVLSYGFASFIYNGGKIRMIINDILSSDDVSAISMAHEPGELPYFDLNNLEDLAFTLNSRNKHFFDCLAWLIRNDRIEIKIVRMVNGSGIAHTKCGTFSDGINKVGFEGSVNFSLSALMHNKESLGVYCDWNGVADNGRIKGIQSSFDKTFKGEDDDVEFIEATALKGYIIEHSKPKHLQELLDNEQELIDNIDKSSIPSTVRKALSKAKERIVSAINTIKEKDRISNSPHFPFPAGPREYQSEAFTNWKNNGQKGFFAMATGTGKTITSLNCLLEIYKHSNYYKAIIVVPTTSLVDQWADECRKFGFDSIVKIYSHNTSWKEEVARLTMLEQLNATTVDYILIVTYASLIRESVYSKLFSFARTKLLFIADEAHNMGASQVVKLLPKIPYKRRIGLSATPERQFDDSGNKKIADFFGFNRDEYTFSYPMDKAIKNNVLCRYFYFPHIVNLTETEFDEYLALSTRIAKYMTFNGDKFKDDPMLTALLIKRKRIVHKAVNKQKLFNEILQKRYEETKSLKYTLVYVPEGNSSDIDDEIADNIYNDEESVHLIDLYTNIVKNIDSHITVAQFASNSKNRSDLLSDFASGRLDVLTSMKCLDEGVDVPRSELAIFCASTGNPRQFIQRRGRILRNHNDKQYAIIHDLVVAPMINRDSPAYLVERNLLRTELRRVKDFASLSENPSATLKELTPILNHFNLNIYEDDSAR